MKTNNKYIVSYLIGKKKLYFALCPCCMSPIGSTEIKEVGENAIGFLKYGDAEKALTGYVLERTGIPHPTENTKIIIKQGRKK
jgi:hypothetical protein